MCGKGTVRGGGFGGVMGWVLEGFFHSSLGEKKAGGPFFFAFCGSPR